MKKMIKRESDQGEKMVVSSIRNCKSLYLFMLFLLFLFSCNKENENDSILLDSINLSNEIYIENVNSLREFFVTKKEEEPLKFKETYEKIAIIENEVIEYSKLKTVKEKKAFIEDMTMKIKSISHADNIKFACLNIEDENITLFNSIAENDFNRNLYIVYTKFYSYHLKVY